MLEFLWSPSRLVYNPLATKVSHSSKAYHGVHENRLQAHEAKIQQRLFATHDIRNRIAHVIIPTLFVTLSRVLYEAMLPVAAFL